MDLTHGMADVEPGLRLHYVTAGEGERTIVLMHGFPQTWWEWHKVIPGLVGGGLRVIAPDLRGAGHSFRPAGGYDKITLAGDVRKLLREHLELAVGGEISTSGTGRGDDARGRLRRARRSHRRNRPLGPRGEAGGVHARRARLCRRRSVIRPTPLE